MTISADSAVARKARTAEQKESARQVGELAALRRMLIASEGTFSLSFAVYNVVRLRDELLNQLTGEFPGVVSVRLGPSTQDILEEVRGQACGAASGKPAAIFVLDLERLLAPEARADQILRSLNASRELWETFRCPVVFWLAEHAATMVAAKAVDFWRYRSHSFEFAAAPDIASGLTAERFPGYGMIVGMPYEEKRFRRAELERRIADAGDPPSKNMLPHVLDWMYELATLDEIFCDWESAEATKRRAMSFAEREYGPESPEYALGLNNLAQLLQETNRLAEAEPLMRRALAIDEQSYGAEHPRIATDLNNLAGLLQATNRLAEAEPSMRRALAIDEQSYGAEHPSVASDLNNLAQLLQATNRLAEAEPLMRRALAIEEQAYGVEHPRVATVLNNLASLLQDTSRLAEAEPLMRRALAIDEQAYGSEHPRVATKLNNLATLLEAKAEDAPRQHDSDSRATLLAEAESLSRRQFEILLKFTAATGHRHPQLQTAVDNYAALLQALGRSDAEAHQELNDLGSQYGVSLNRGD